jgi:hypothetical protein
MGSLAQRLRALGFASGDYLLQDDSDGRGPYIRNWYSSKPCPFPDEQRDPPGKIVRPREEPEHPARLARKVKRDTRRPH